MANVMEVAYVIKGQSEANVDLCSEEILNTERFAEVYECGAVEKKNDHFYTTITGNLHNEINLDDILIECSKKYCCEIETVCFDGDDGILHMRYIDGKIIIDECSNCEFLDDLEEDEYADLVDEILDNLRDLITLGTVNEKCVPLTEERIREFFGITEREDNFQNSQKIPTMHIPEPLIIALNEIDDYYYDAFSGIQIFCEDSIKKDVAVFFKKTFFEKYKEDFERVIRTYGETFHIEDIDEEGIEKAIKDSIDIKEPIQEIVFTDYGLFIKPGNLSFNDEWQGGDNCIEGMGEALPETMETVAKKFPNIAAQGYVAYQTSDLHCNEIIEMAFSPNPPCPKHNDYLYDFVGKKLNEVLSSEEYCEAVLEFCDDEKTIIKEVINTIK